MNFTPAPHITQQWHLSKPSATGRRGMVASQVKAAAEQYAGGLKVKLDHNSSAGDIIGYVGETGDTSTPHDHFEWHPKTMPSSWPTSPYGYRTVGSAVNPWPILQSVC